MILIKYAILTATWLAVARPRVIAVIELRRESPGLSGVPDPRLKAELQTHVHLETYRKGAETVRAYPDIFHKGLAKEGLRLASNDSRKSITDIVLLAKGILDNLGQAGSAAESASLPVKDLSHVLSNLDKMVYAYGIELGGPQSLCTFRPYDQQCCPHIAAIFPSFVDKAIIAAEKEAISLRMAATFRDAAFDAPSATSAGLAEDKKKAELDPAAEQKLKDLNKLAESRQAQIQAMKLGLRPRDSPYITIGAHNLLNKIFTDIEDVVSRDSHSLAYRAYSIQLLHAANMLDLTVAFKLEDRVCRRQPQMSSSPSGPERADELGRCSLDRVPEVFRFEVHRVGYNYYVRARLDGQAFPLNSDERELSGIFEVVRYFSALNTYEYFVVCRSGQLERTSRAEIKSQKLNKYFLILAIALSVITVYKRVRERQAEAKAQRTAADKPKRD